MFKPVRQVMSILTIGFLRKIWDNRVGRPPKQENYPAPAVEKVIKSQKMQSSTTSPFMFISASLLLAMNPFQLSQFAFSRAVRCISFWRRRICRKP